MGSRMFVFFAGLYVRAHAHLSIMMGYAKSWWGIEGIAEWLGAAPRKKREMLLSILPHK